MPSDPDFWARQYGSAAKLGPCASLHAGLSGACRPR